MTERALTAMRERADAAEGEVERLRQEVRRAGAGNGELRARADAAEAALQSAPACSAISGCGTDL